MTKKIYKDRRKQVTLLGGGRFEQIGFAETIKAEFDKLGFYVALADEPEEKAACSMSPRPIGQNDVVVIIVENHKKATLQTTHTLVKHLYPRSVILALRDPGTTLCPKEWPSNMRAIASWEELCERVGTFLTLVSEGLALFDPKLVTWNGADDARKADMLPEEDTDNDVTKVTEREAQVACEIYRGSKNSAIASELGIKVNTVNTHVNSLIRKLGVHNRTEVAVWYSRSGLKARFGPHQFVK